jgi:hypothetical protein|uniref:Sporulation protein YpjB (SpoYpjB) n=1 Tax=Myoviridae sp. ctkfK18 TaxID=2825165 RepID=A0A8S5VGT4_9CAUD|nr:MAG TPA: Sporulation protein YpjB (SpoYpjB) [Myoviridae sp. ctkfK18]
MSLVKNIAIGVGSVVVLGLGYLSYKKLRGKKEKDEYKIFEGIFNKEDFKKRIQEDEELIKNLENLHYDESVIKPFRDSLKSKKEFLATLK